MKFHPLYPPFISATRPLFPSLQKHSSMPKIYRVLFFSVLFIGINTQDISGQIEMSLQMTEDGAHWGVFVKGAGNTRISDNVYLASGQVTIVAPKGVLPSPLQEFKSETGQWIESVRINRPPENRNFDYLDISYQISTFPSDAFKGNEQQVLLFTFKAVVPCPDNIRLMNNSNDPFAAPNSAGNNPGNSFPLIDNGTGRLLDWKRNYKPCPDVCTYCDPTSFLSSNKEISEPDFKIFPNPSSGIFTFTGNKNKFSKVLVFNALGSQLAEIPIQENHLDLNGLSNGLYSIRFEIEDLGFHTKRIIIKK